MYWNNQVVATSLGDRHHQPQARALVVLEERTELVVVLRQLIEEDEIAGS